MDDVLPERRKKLEAIEDELEDVRRRLDRVSHIVETTDLEVSDATSRIRDHRERQENAATEARSVLAERKVLLDSGDSIAESTKDMSEFLMTSDLTETNSFIQTFVKEIRAKPGNAAIHCTMPTPPDSPMGGGDMADIELREPVMNTGRRGGPRLTVDSTMFELMIAL